MQLADDFSYGLSTAVLMTSLRWADEFIDPAKAGQVTVRFAW
jgi:hypothetical protein